MDVRVVALLAFASQSWAARVAVEQGSIADTEEAAKAVAEFTKMETDPAPDGFMDPTYSDCGGHDLIPGFWSPTPSGCAQRCITQIGCVAFSYSHESQFCWLKQETCLGKDLRPTGARFYVREIRGYTTRTGDCPGHTLDRAVRFTVAECAAACGHHGSSCKGFSYKGTGDCVLKSATCDETETETWTLEFGVHWRRTSSPFTFFQRSMNHRNLHARGRWRPRGPIQANGTKITRTATVQSGSESTESTATSSEVSSSLELGFEFPEGISGGASVTNSEGREVTRSETLSQIITRAESREFTFTRHTNGLYLWQWRFDFYDEADAHVGSYDTEYFAQTASGCTYPACLPTHATDIDRGYQVCDFSENKITYSEEVIHRCRRNR